MPSSSQLRPISSHIKLKLSSYQSPPRHFSARSAAMADAGRKDFTDKVSEAVVPDSQKSTSQKAKEGVTGTGDKLARGAQPEQNKSAGQSVADSLGSNKDSAKGNSGESTLDKAKHAIGMDKK